MRAVRAERAWRSQLRGRAGDAGVLPLGSTAVPGEHGDSLTSSRDRVATPSLAMICSLDVRVGGPEAGGYDV